MITQLMTAHLPWVHKHAPHSTKDLVGHEQEISQLKAFVQSYKKGQKPILLVGKPGVGKTSIVHALAKELDLEILEINASDARNKDAIESIVGGAVAQQSLFFRGKIILIDEVDGVSGQQDRGGIGALVAIIEKSRFPIIFTANDMTNDKLKPLVKACTVLELALTNDHIHKRLLHIATKEQLNVTSEVLASIGRRSSGDLRSAINDLQSIHTGSAITKEQVAALDERLAKEALTTALLRVFKTTHADIARGAFDNVDEDVDSLLLWIDETIPQEYKDRQDLARAFAALAQADIFFGRIRKWQYYRYYVYIYDFLTAGIAIAKDQRSPGSAQYKRPERILKMWIANQRNAKRKKIAQTLAPHLHTSTRRTYETLPFLKARYRNDKKALQVFCKRYDIDEETADWFTK